LLSLDQDRKLFTNDQTRYVFSWALLALSLPFQGYMMFKMMKDPIKNRKYFASYAFLSFGALGFFGYSARKHQQVENVLYDKYLGNVTMQGL